MRALSRLSCGAAVALSLAACSTPADADAAAAGGAARGVEAAAAATLDAIRAVQRGEVRAELERYYADLSARDWPAFAGHFWPGATITTLWQPADEAAPRVVVMSLADFVKEAPNGPGSKSIFEERMTGAETRIEGDLAQVWARYEAKFGEPGEVEQWTGLDAFTLMRHEGEWKIVALAFAREE